MKLKKSLKNAKIYKCEKMNNKMTQKFGEKKQKMRKNGGKERKERKEGKEGRSKKGVNPIWGLAPKLGIPNIC